MSGAGKCVELQATAERTPFGDPDLAELIVLARAGILELQRLQQQTLTAFVYA